MIAARSSASDERQSTTRTEAVNGANIGSTNIVLASLNFGKNYPIIQIVVPNVCNRGDFALLYERGGCIISSETNK